MPTSVIFGLVTDNPDSQNEFIDRQVTRAMRWLAQFSTRSREKHMLEFLTVDYLVDWLRRTVDLRMAIALYLLLNYIEEQDIHSETPIERLPDESDDDYNIRVRLSRLFH